MSRLLLLLFLCVSSPLLAQQDLTVELLETQAFRFTLDDQHHFADNAQTQWQSWIGDHQFVGIAEIHNSKQLSLFTTALLPLLEEQGFRYFALEQGPNVVAILNELAADTTTDMGSGIKQLNRQYGKKSLSKTPFIFANKVKDAVFLQQASELGFTFWGIDQEFSYAYEMLLDRLHTLQSRTGQNQEALYLAAKKLVHKNQFKKKVKGQPVYCWYQENEVINDYLNSFQQNPEAMKLIADLRKSWDIYCKAVTGGGSNQDRADYMKENFEDYYAKAGEDAKVLLKLGNVHLTHSLSPFYVDDMGKMLHEKAEQNGTGFLSIRHLMAYQNGKSNVGKSGWQSVGMFLQLGRKTEWTVVDLRPFRKQLADGSIKANEKYTYEIMNYDLLLLPPDDSFDQPNY